MKGNRLLTGILVLIGSLLFAVPAMADTETETVPAVIYVEEAEAASEETSDVREGEEAADTAEDSEAAEDEEPEITGNMVVNFARRFLGGKYRYGGTSLTNGTDCSGFTMSVYNKFGISLPHSSKSQRSVGTKIGSLEEAEAGDLICYSGHVALYIGDGQIIHALNERKGIIISDARYNNILAIRRVL